jgi:hypothetical protein
MSKGTVYVVSRNGLGQAPEDLQRILAVNFFGLSVGKMTDIVVALEGAEKTVSV